MTERELKKLGRVDLIEMLLDLTRENDQLRGELAEVRQQLESRTIIFENAGSLAEAALRVNGIFEAAQAACDQYAQNIDQQKALCDRMEQETREKCARMLEKAKRDADEYWEYVRGKVRDLYLEKNEAYQQYVQDGTK